MGLTLAEVRQRLESDVQDAHTAHDESWINALALIASQLHMIEGAKTLEEQKAGCQQVSNAILAIQMVHPDRALVQKLDSLRVEFGQFGFMGRA